MKKTQLILILLVAALVSCTKPADTGNISVGVHYSVNGSPLVTDSLCYVNEAGNHFLITEIQWFLSNIQLLGQDGKWYTLKHLDMMDHGAKETEHIFYIDTDIPESHTLHGQKIPIGHYSLLRFTFGLDENDNQTGIFNDSPESEMFWPYVLGGGYHYMKLNGKFVDTEGRLNPLAIHLGIGQNEDCTEFYQNYFIVEFPIDFDVKVNTENSIDLTMVIDNWFRYSNTIDFNVYGSSIMQNQAAQQALKENGQDVFVIGKPQGNKNNIAMGKDNKLAEKLKKAMQKAAPKPHYWSWESVKERLQDLRFKDSKI